MRVMMLFYLLLILILPLSARGSFEHPRLLFSSDDVAALRERIEQEPYKEMYLQLLENMETAEEKSHQLLPDTLRLEHQGFYASLAVHYAFVGLLEEDTVMAQKAYACFERIIADTARHSVVDVRLFGLTRAHILQSVAYVYDFASPLLGKEQGRVLNQFMLELMFSVHTSMGYEGNYALESNWMGVRYGSVLLAALAYDDFAFERYHHGVQWDAQRRLQDHLRATFTRNGWNVESLGYFEYNASFTFPALLAVQRRYDSSDFFHVSNFVPNLFLAMHPHATATVHVTTKSTRYLKADFSDDNVFAHAGLYTLAMPIMPDEQVPYLYWMYDYLTRDGLFEDMRPYLIYALMHYETSITGENPEEAGWLHYVCDEHGILFMRNRFQDENDIVSAMTATAMRKNGHTGPDNLSFRIYGLDGIWVVGGGRTDQMAAQTNLFPLVDIDSLRGDQKTGTLLAYDTLPNGSGSIQARGSCAGVNEHQRFFTARYDQEMTGVEAVFVLADISENGRIWRLSTPDFNQVEVLPDGFLITGPSGASLKATVLQHQQVEVKLGKARYGGSVMRHNTGVCYHGDCEEYVKTIDVLCQGDIQVVMTLTRVDQVHPVVSLDLTDSHVLVGDMEISIPDVYFR